MKRWNEASAAVGEGQPETYAIGLKIASGGEFRFDLRIEAPRYRAVRLSDEVFNTSFPEHTASDAVTTRPTVKYHTRWIERGEAITKFNLRVVVNPDMVSTFREGTNPAGRLAAGYGLGGTLWKHEWEHAFASMQLSSALLGLFSDAGWTIEAAVPEGGSPGRVFVFGGAGNIDPMPFVPATKKEAVAASMAVTDFIAESLATANLVSTHYLDPGTKIVPPRLDWSVLKQLRGGP